MVQWTTRRRAARAASRSSPPRRGSARRNCWSPPSRTRPAPGLKPLVAHASELERNFAFGIARQLLEPFVVPASQETRGQLLEGAARQAVAALDLEPTADLGGDLHATLHGLYWMLA